MLKFLINKMSRKSQSSMEFFTLTGLAFLAVILFVAASANEAREFRDQKEFLLIKDLGLKLQKEITIAASVEDGYERIFTLPERLESNVDYYTVIINNTLTINSSKSAFFVPMPATFGKNFTKGQNKVEKDGGKVYINR